MFLSNLCQPIVAFASFVGFPSLIKAAFFVCLGGSLEISIATSKKQNKPTQKKKKHHQQTLNQSTIKLTMSTEEKITLKWG